MLVDKLDQHNVAQKTLINKEILSGLPCLRTQPKD